MKTIISSILSMLDVRQFITRNGKFFPPYAIILFFLGLVAFLWIQRIMGVNDVSDTLMSILTGVVFTWVSVWWVIDTKNNGDGGGAV